MVPNGKLTKPDWLQRYKKGKTCLENTKRKTFRKKSKICKQFCDETFNLLIQFATSKPCQSKY